MSLQEQNWWIFLNSWSLAIKNKNIYQLNISNLIEELDLDTNLVHEFVNFFQDDFNLSKEQVVSICMGGQCRAKGNEKIFAKLVDANLTKIPEKQLKIKPVLCLHECDKAPCSQYGAKLHLGDDLSWVERLIKE